MHCTTHRDKHIHIHTRSLLTDWQTQVSFFAENHSIEQFVYTFPFMVRAAWCEWIPASFINSFPPPVNQILQLASLLQPPVNVKPPKICVVNVKPPKYLWICTSQWKTSEIYVDLHQSMENLWNICGSAPVNGKPLKYMWICTSQWKTSEIYVDLHQSMENLWNICGSAPVNGKPLKYMWICTSQWKTSEIYVAVH